jgi:actin-related protein 8
VIVIHPGSRFTRIGRACDINPVTVPTVIARKLRGAAGTVPEPTYVNGIERPQPGMERTRPIQGTGGGDEYSVSSQSNDPVSCWFSYRLSFPPYHLLPFVGHELAS